MVRTVSHVDDAAKVIEELPPAPLTIVGIDGLAASGKSSLVAALLGRRGDWQVLRLDELQRPTPGRAWEEWSDAQCAANFVDTDRLTELVGDLLVGRQVSFRAYDWSIHAEDPELRTLVPEGVLLVEGVYSLRARNLYGLTAWVTVDHDERMRRIAARAPAEPGWQESWFRGERWQSWSAEPAAHADVVMSGRMSL